MRLVNVIRADSLDPTNIADNDNHAILCCNSSHYESLLSRDYQGRVAVIDVKIAVKGNILQSDQSECYNMWISERNYNPKYNMSYARMVGEKSPQENQEEFVLAVRLFSCIDTYSRS